MTIHTQNSTSRSTRERNGWIFLARKIQASNVEGRRRNPVWHYLCVIPAGTSTNLTARIDGHDNTHTHKRYNGGFLPYILLLTQPPTVACSSMLLLYYRISLLVYSFNNLLHCLLFCYVWCPCMAINVSAQFNGGLLPDIILPTQGYYHRGTRLKTIKRFCLCSLWKHDIITTLFDMY